MGEENLIRTYCAIARATAGNVISWTPQAVMSVGNFPHPLCNFAVLLDPTAIDSVRMVAEGKPAFNVYTFTDDVADGLRHEYELVIMERPGERTEGAQELVPVTLPLQRSSVCQFMTQQFFGSQSAQVREMIGKATARAEGLELYAFSEGTSVRIRAAAMLHRTRGTVGLYNLCVDAAARHRGLGRHIVSRVVTQAASEDRSVTLQCDASLRAWYGSQGFVETGILHVWSLIPN